MQSADGSLVVGDSHHYGAAPEPFADQRVDELIIEHLHKTLKLQQCRVSERWVGIYPSSATTDCLIDKPDDATRMVLVTSGTGASTAFGIAEDASLPAGSHNFISRSPNDPQPSTSNSACRRLRLGRHHHRLRLLRADGRLREAVSPVRRDQINIEDVRCSMAMAKWDHIKALGTLAAQRVAQQWEERCTAKPLDNADVDRLYEIFTPMNAAIVADFATWTSSRARWRW